MELSNCLVCSKPSHGIHFGAESCRACAAYFRRAVLKKYTNLKCRKGHGKCERQLELCKKCRLQRCYEAGMSEEKLQLGRDPVCSGNKQIVQYHPFGRPSFIFIDSEILKNSKRAFIDFTKLIKKASNILESESKSPINMNTLNKLTYALTTLQKPPKECPKIGKNEILKLWEIGFLKVTEWFTYCDKFQELPLSMRVEFLKTVWTTWTCLQNFVMTANRNLVADRKDSSIILVNEYVINVDTLDLDLTWLTRYTKEHFLQPDECFKREAFINSLMNLRPTAQEITYMLSIFSFRRAAKMLNGNFESLSENMIEILGDELHNYYINEMKVRHYALRIAKMMNIVNNLEVIEDILLDIRLGFQRNVHEKMERTELARMFDCISVDFSHPELIYGKK